MKFKFVLVCLLLGLSSMVHAQLLQWNTYGNIGTELTEPSVFNDPNITTADLTFGAGITPAGNGLRFGGTSWFDSGNTVAGSTLTEAIAGNNYIQFVVTPNFNYAFTPTSFVFSWGRSNAQGPPNVALRSSFDGFASNLGVVTGLNLLTNGNTITISGLTNISTTTTFRIYGYGGTGTGGTAGFDQSAPAPGIVNVQLNGTTQSLGPISVTSGDWNVASTWSTNAVPTATDNVIISLNHTVYTNTALTRTGTTRVFGAFELRNGGFASGTDFTYMNTTAALNFNTSTVYGVNNTHVYWPVSNGPNNVAVLAGGIAMNSANRTVTGTFSTAAGITLNTSTLLLNGTCRIDSGGFFLSAPVYGSASILVYNPSGVYGRGFEWSALGVGTIGTTPGYPNAVQISNNTTLNYINGGVAGAVGIKAIATNLTIDTGSALHMNYGAVSAGGALIIGGNLSNAGTLTLGEANGDDLKLAGNFSNTGTFNGNNRAVFFTKTGTQTISSSSALTIPYVVFQPSTGNTLVQLLNSLTVSAPLGGNAISFSATLDSFDINGNTLTIGTPGLANTIFGTGTFRGSTTSNLTLLGIGSIGTLKFNTTPSTSLNLATLIINRTAGSIAAVMGSTLTINSSLVLSNGILDVGNNTLVIGQNATIIGGSAANFIIADSSAGTLAGVRKFVNAPGTYSFPIGDNAASADGMQYSPVSITLNGGTYPGTGYMTFSVNDVKDPALDASTDYITRYWEMKRTLSNLNPTSYQINATYYATDVVGNENLCLSNQWSGSSWLNNGVTSAANTLTIDCTQLVTATRVTKGYRDPEINVTQGATNYLTASTYTFANTGLGNFTDVVFTVQNLGQQNLNLAAATLSGAVEFTLLSAYTSPVLGPTGTTTFTIRFYPLTAGTFAASISIPNNDASGAENPYVINFSGTGFCASETLTATPTSGPVGTEITLTNSVAFLPSISAAFNTLTASIIPVSAAQIKLVVPVSAVTGTIVITNSLGCTVSTPFTVVDFNANSCQGSTFTSELFISEVTDATSGGLTYVEIYNGTGSAVNLSNYSVKTAGNGGAYSNTVALANFNLANGSTYVLSVGSDGLCTVPGGDGSYANQTGPSSGGINFDVNGNDHIGLFRNSSLIDSFGVYGANNWADALGLGDRGATFRRKPTGALPSALFVSADWNITNWAGTGAASCSTNDYSNIGLYLFTSTNLPPVIITQPTYTPTCKSASISVTAAEGYNGAGDAQELVYQWYGVAPNVTSWTALSNSGIYTGATTATLAISDVSGIDGYQFYCQVRENSATCYAASNAVKVTATSAVTWNGSAWTPAAPTITTPAILAGNYNTSTHGNLDACSLTINSGFTATLTTNSYINIQNDLTVQANATLQIQDSGSLVMIENAGLVTNNGTIQVARNTAPFDKFDYTYWSSPVTAANLGATFPSWRTDYSFSFNTANFSDTQTINNLGVVTANVPDGFDDAAPYAWTFAGTAATMTPGKGYAIMMPTTQASYPSAPISVTYSGTVNTGTILTPLSLSGNATDSADDYNLIGNPYPSSIDANAFIDANLNTSGSLYFWTHVGAISVSNPGPDAQNFISDDYAVYNKTGGTRTSYTGSALPNGKIGTGQAFMVEAVTATNVQFSNSMRNKTYSNSQFFRPSAAVEITNPNAMNRFWLNLKNSDGMFSQQLIGYTDQATYAADFAYDALVAQTKNYLSFYSTIGESNYRIQARPTFTTTDEVPVGYFAAVSGLFTIELDAAEGIFASQNQAIYLEDRELQTLHDLTQSPYTFTTNSGTFSQRFVIRYTPELGVDPFDTLATTVQIFTRNNQLEIVSSQEEIERVEVYDLLGRKLFGQAGVSATQFTVQEPLNQSIVLVRVQLKSGVQCTKKIGK